MKRDTEQVAVDDAIEVRSEDWEAFKLEQRGIDWVPPSDRHAQPQRLLWMWSGTTLNILVFVYGSLLVAVFGLSITQAILVSVLGTFGGYTLLAAGSLAGPQAGTSQLVVSRAAFGYNWNRVNALCNWLLVVGYEVADLAIIVLAAEAIFNKAGVGSSTGLKIALIIVAVAIQLPLPLYGHATVVKVMRPLAILLAVFFVVMTILAAEKIHLPAHQASASWGSVTEALALTLSGGGLGWVAYGSDYTRYIPQAASKAKIFWSILIGAAVPQSLLMVLGAVVTTALPAASDEISGLPKLFPGWFVVPYLLLAIVSMYAVNTVDLYSSGLSLQAIGVKVKRWQAVCIDLAICTAILFPVVFSSHFNTLLSDFLLFGLAWISPYVGIYLADLALRRNRFDPPSLFSATTGIYRRPGGVNVAALVAQLVGTACCMLWLDAYPAYTGPIANALGGKYGSDLDIFFGGGVAALIYGVLAFRRVRAEGDEAVQHPTEFPNLAADPEAVALTGPGSSLPG